MNYDALTRRAFLATATTFAASCATTRTNTARVVPGRVSPNEKLNIAGIGVGGMGGGNLRQCADENIVALCDVHAEYAGRAFARYPDARTFVDFRDMFDKMGDDIDAVIIATPDHTHAVIAMEAIRRNKHIYLQKPLAHNLHEVRAITEAARKAGVQTQMGNQGHSTQQIRMLKEWIADDAIGEIREVYAWSDRPVGGAPYSDFPVMKRPSETPPVPATLDWDRWLGPAPYRPYHPIYCPMTWRGWWDFGTGALGDMGCHILDPAFYALDLGHPESVQATTSHWEEGIQEETYPRASIIRYEFPARGKRPPVKLTWYDGRLKPPIPACFEPERRIGTNGAIFVGEDAAIMHDSHGASGVRIVPETTMKAYKRPEPTIPRVEGGKHEMDWVRACKDGRPASSSFDYGGPLTEMVLLGVLAMRAKDRRLQWDGDNLRITNDAEANELVNPPYREGWTL